MCAIRVAELTASRKRLNERRHGTGDKAEVDP